MGLNSMGKLSEKPPPILPPIVPKLSRHRHHHHHHHMAAPPPSSAALFLFSIASLLLLTHGRLALDPSDLDALNTVQRDLGMEIVNGRRNHSFCSFPGVVCERRLSDNESYVLIITRLVFKSQSLNGFLSPEIGRLSELKELSVPNNRLVDRMPPQLLDCNKLQILNLRNNLFSGEIPSELSALVHLRVLDLASNKFSGDLNFLKYFPNLERLSLADNLFSGKIPPSVRSFRNLRFFNVSGNSFLDGQVPSLNHLDLPEQPKRYSLIERSWADAPSPSRPSSSYSSSSTAPAPSPVGNPRHHKNKKKAAGMLLGFTAGAIAGSISGFVFSVLFKITLATIRGGGKGGPVIFSPLIKNKEDLAFLAKEDGIASLEIIGRGGCGEVYKAELPGSNGKMIAIKKIKQPPKDATELAEEDSKLLHKKMRQIKSEINTVGHIRHRNLLPLVAHVSRPDCHYLVYEFMKNGSLQDLLDKVSRGEGELDWPARHRIAVGVASGLEYLHMNHNPRIIHRDLKPGNILLDDDMEARIADFGLAKAVPEANTHVSTSNVVGTLGYIAPEYHQTLKFTDRSDIYSFGIILAALVMGKLPSDDFFQHTAEMALVKWLRNVMTSENPREAIDTRLMGNGYEEQMLLVLKIACFCTVDEAKQRPSSKEVRTMLSQIKHEPQGQ